MADVTEYQSCVINSFVCTVRDIWLWCLVYCVCFTRYRLLSHLCAVIQYIQHCNAKSVLAGLGACVVPAVD